MRGLLFLFAACLLSTFSFAQLDTALNIPFDYREHGSDKKGKWNISSERLYKDSMIYYSSVYGSTLGDTCVYFFDRKWFYQNGQIRRHIYVNFKKRKCAKIIDKKYSENGELIEDSSMKARRRPEQNKPDRVNWDNLN